MVLAAANVAVGYIGFVLDSHHSYGGIDFRRQGEKDFIFVPVDTVAVSSCACYGGGQGLPNAHALFNICRTDTLTEFDDELGDLLDVNDILALVRVLFILNDFGTPSDLEGMVFLHSLPVCCNIP